MRLQMYFACTVLILVSNFCLATGLSYSQVLNSTDEALLRIASPASANEVKRDDSDAVERLLSQGANPNTRGELGRTVLMGAAGNGFTRIVDLLISRGANVNAVSASGQTALMQASLNGRVPTVKALLKNGALLDSTDKDDY